MTMTTDDVKAIVSAVLAEQKRLHEDDIDNVVLRTLVTILTSFGIEEQDRLELRADLLHLRKWRKSVDQATSVTFKVAVATLVGGFIAALWIGIKALVGK